MTTHEGADTPALQPADPVCMVSIEVDGRQRYLFEADKWQEMLGASRIMARTKQWAKEAFAERGLYLVQPVSGEIRAWAAMSERAALLDATWEIRRHLADHGIEHTCGYLETTARHFLRADGPPPDPAHADRRLDDRDTGAPASLAAVHRRMTARVAVRKSAKAGEDARPVCSLFAPCRLQGTDFANEWRSVPDADEPDEPRRRQRGYRARSKQDTWLETRAELDSRIRERLREALAGRVPDLAKLVSELELDFAEHMDADEGQRDRYIAFLCADGDGFGSRLLPAIDWNSHAWGDDQRLAWERNAVFSESLDRAFEEAFTSAMVAVSANAIATQVERDRVHPTGGQKTRRYVVPVLLQLLGGDDLWVLARRDVALDLAARFAQRFAELATENAELSTALRVANLGLPDQRKLNALTISIGVAFAKSGYPIHAMAEAAESLLSQAKALRKGECWGRQPAPELGCVDWHRIESSLSERVSDAREEGWQYDACEPKPGLGSPAASDGQTCLVLTTRPWSQSECAAFLEARLDFKQVARRKREQLEDVLRRGYTLSMLGWEAWWKSLTAREHRLLERVRQRLGNAGIALSASPTWDVPFVPWNPLAAGGNTPTIFRTPWLDLMALEDVVGRVAADEAVNESEEADGEAAEPAKGDE